MVQTGNLEGAKRHQAHLGGRIAPRSPLSVDFVAEVI